MVKRHRIAVGVLVAVVGFGAAALAATGPWRSFVGAECQPFYGGSVKYYYSTALNDTASSQSVICPVVAGDLAGDGIHEDAIINVFDRHPTQDVTCTYFTLAADGSSLISVTASTTGSSSSAMALDFGYVITGPYSMITCSLPPTQTGGASGVATYKVRK